MRPVVNTEKHYVQFSLATTTAGTITNRTIVNAVAVPTGDDEVREGSIVSAVYIEIWITGDDAVASTAIITLDKLGQGTASMTAAESADLGSYANKKNILHTMMGLAPPNTQYPMAAVKGWFKIPKGKQRFGFGDRLNLNIHGQSDGLTTCGFMTYKEQF